MINEANEPSSACRLWRIYQVETSTPPKSEQFYSRLHFEQGQAGIWSILVLIVNPPRLEPGSLSLILTDELEDEQ